MIISLMMDDHSCIVRKWCQQTLEKRHCIADDNAKYSRSKAESGNFCPKETRPD